MSQIERDDRLKALAAAAPLLTNHWRTVLKKLGVSQTEIQDVVNLHRHKRPAEVVYQALVYWQELYMGEVSLEDLIKVLQEMNLTDVIDMVKSYQKPKSVSEIIIDDSSGRVQRGDAVRFMARADEEFEPMRRSLPMLRLDKSSLSQKLPIDPPLLSPKLTPPKQLLTIPTERIRGDFGTIVPRVKSAESSVRPAPSIDGTANQIPPMLTYSVVATPVSFKTSGFPEAPPPEEENPVRIFEYNYIASVLSPIKQYKREPRYGGICFLQEGHIVLLDKANSQIEVHECQRIFDGKRFAFRRVFKVPQARKSKLGGIATYGNVIIVWDVGDRCLMFFTAKGKPAGQFRFRHQPKCIALRDSRAAIAFWNTNNNKGSIVTYRANIKTDKDGAKTFSLFLPNAVAGVTNNYSDIAITANQEIVAMTDDGRLFLFGFQSQLSSTYVCHAVVDSTDLYCVRTSKDGVIVSNSYRDTLIQIPFIGDGSNRTFDTKNSRPILNEEDGINGLKTFAVFEEDNDIAVIDNFGSLVRMYGTRRIQYQLQ